MSQELVKLVILGSGAVGKTTMAVQFVEGIFVRKCCPTIEDNYRKLVDVDENQFLVEIIDTSGTEQFTAMRDLYIKNGQGFLLVYSITNESSFYAIPDMYDTIVRIKGFSQIFPTLIVGNKCDLLDKRVVSTEKGESFAAKTETIFMEASARENINVHEIFHTLICLILAENPQIKPVKRKGKLRGGCIML